MKRLLPGLCIVLGLGMSAQAQSLPVVDWQKKLGGNKNDVPFSFTGTSDGGYVILGTTLSDAGTGDVTSRPGASNQFATDYWVVKLDKTGNKEWEKSFGGNSSEEPIGSIIQTTDGGYMIAGGTYSSDISPDVGGRNRGIWVIKLQSDGTQSWQKVYGTNGEDFAQTVMSTSDGGYLIGGSVAPPAGGGGGLSSTPKSVKAITLKIDASGNELWWKQHDDIADSTADIFRLFPAQDGGYIIGGRAMRVPNVTGMTPTLTGDFLGAKLNAQGNKVWSKTLGGTRFDLMSGAVHTADGGLVLCGHTHSEDDDLDGVKKHSDNVSDLWVVKLNAFGDSVLWSKSYGGSDADSIAAITATQDGGFLIAACSKSSASGDFKGTNKGGTDLWILKLDAEGNLEWEDNFGGTGHEVVVGITAGTDGTFAVVGTSTSTNGDLTGVTDNGGTDFWIVKFKAPDADSMVVRVQNNGQPEITTANGTLQLEAKVYPTLLPQQFNWTVAGGTGSATVDANGLVTAGANNGTVWVKAEWITDNSFVDSIEVTINVTEDPGNGHFNVSNLTKNLNAVSIYPNPAKSLLTIELSSVHPSLDIVIYDMMGRSVQKFEVPENGLMKAPQFDISQLSAGVYLIELRAENATTTQRISVQ